MLISWATDNTISVEELKAIKKEIKAYIHPGDILYVYQAISEENFNKIFGTHAEYVKGVLGVNPELGWQYAPSGTAIQQEVLQLMVTGFWRDSYGAYTWHFSQFSNIACTENCSTSFENEYDPNNFYFYDPMHDATIPVDINTRTETNYYLSDGAWKLHPKKEYSNWSVWDQSNFYWTDLIDDLILIKETDESDVAGEISGTLISDLATYFRDYAYGEVPDDKSVTKLTPR